MHKIKLDIKKVDDSSKEPNKVLCETSQYKSLQQMNECINTIVKNNVFVMFIELIQKIAHDYSKQGITFNELKDKYLSFFQDDLCKSNLYSDMLSLNLDSIDIKNVITNKNEDEQKDVIRSDKCMARTSSGVQCSRKKQKDSDFCGSHSHSQPNGRIDQPKIDKNLSNVTTISDKSVKIPNEHDEPNEPNEDVKIHNEPDDHPIIDANIETIDGIDYILDSEGNLYKSIDGATLDENTELNMDSLKKVGKRDEDGSIIWLSESDLHYM